MPSGLELTMRTIREVLRLGLSGTLSLRDIARSLRITHPTVKKYVLAANEAGLDWSAVTAMDDAALQRIICTKPSRDLQKPLPDYGLVHQELKKRGVTLELLWQEYKAAHPDGYQMTQFRRYYRQFVKKLKVSMRQRYKFGESLFVDYAGQTVPVYDRHTGEVKQVQIFVAVLGASNYTYAEATPDQSLESWIGSHVRAFSYFKGVPLKTVCDNLKAGVSHACRYEPDINPTYNDLAVHYGTVILPTRVARPRDKAKVETGVLIVERWILAALRNRKFFSLAELNEAIGELLIRLNQKTFKKLAGSRESVYQQQERPALQPLPENAYQFARWKKARVNIDYHIELEGHYYSVPYTLIHKSVDVRYTTHTVEIFRSGRRITSHARDDVRGRHTTIREHMPKSHQEYLDWTPARMIERANKIGPQTGNLIEKILTSRQFPQQGYRSCLGILRLAKEYSPERLEAACRRGLAIGGHSYKSIHAILKSGLENQPWQTKPASPAIRHDNIRGSGYFNNLFQN